MTQEISEKDRLELIFALQKGLTNMMNLDRYPDEPEERISALCTAIIHEQLNCSVQQTGNGGKILFLLIKMKQKKN